MNFDESEHRSLKIQLKAADGITKKSFKICLSPVAALEAYKFNYFVCNSAILQL